MSEWLKGWILGMSPAQVGVQLLGALLVILATCLLFYAQHNKHNPFNAGQMFQDERDRTSAPKLLSVIGGLASVWVVVDMEVNGKLDAMLFCGWLAIIVLGRLGSEYIQSKPPTPAITQLSSPPKDG